jgi:D-glycero-D-manno-heptose 1,7-bisphosphate phosphatase
MVKVLKPAVFLDRDGVLSVPEFREGRSFAPRRVEDFKLYDHSISSLQRLKAADFLLIVVTNQPDVGNGLVGREIVEEMHRMMIQTLPLDAVEVCYHSNNDGCSCRKPMAGMLLRAGERLGVDFNNSFMIGDRGSDILAGKKAGCRTIFIDLGYSKEDPCAPDFFASDLWQATDIVVSECGLTAIAGGGG